MDTTFVYSFSTNEPSTFSKILPFITLILGAIITLGVTQITKYCSNKVHRKKTKLHLIHSIESLILSLDMQNERLANYIEILDKKPNSLPLLARKSGFHLKSIDIIPQKDLFDIFVLQEKLVKNIKESELKIFIDIIEAIRLNKESLFKNTDNIFEKNNEYVRKNNLLYTQIVDKSIAFSVYDKSQLLSNPLEYKRDTLLLELSKKLAEFHHNHDNFTLFELYELVIKPMYNFSSTYKDKEIYSLLHDCYLNLFDCVNNRNNYLEYIKEQNKDFKKCSEELRDIIKFLNK